MAPLTLRLDAAYRLVPPMPDPSYNTDDRSIVSYPLTFQIHAQHPLVIPGDADSSSPLGDLRPTLEAPPPSR